MKQTHLYRNINSSACCVFHSFYFCTFLKKALKNTLTFHPMKTAPALLSHQQGLEADVSGPQNIYSSNTQQSPAAYSSWPAKILDI